jgi:hypothetical protein
MLLMYTTPPAVTAAERSPKIWIAAASTLVSLSPRWFVKFSATDVLRSSSAPMRRKWVAEFCRFYMLRRIVAGKRSGRSLVEGQYFRNGAL